MVEKQITESLNQSRESFEPKDHQKERKSIYEQKMIGNTRELLIRVLDFIQVHRDLQRNSPIQELDIHPFIHPLKFVDLAII